jgi:hypothetical protein
MFANLGQHKSMHAFSLRIKGLRTEFVERLAGSDCQFFCG